MIPDGDLSIIACPDCDLLQREVRLPPGGAARCSRCNAVLYRNTDHSLDRPLAFALAAIVLYLVANVYPMVGLEYQGARNVTTLYGAVRAVWQEEMRIVATLVFTTAILFPGVEVAAVLYLLLPLRFGRVPAGLPLILRWVEHIQAWNMVDVLMLALIVSLVKLGSYASVITGAAFWCFGGLTIMLAALSASLDTHYLWTRACKGPFRAAA